MAEVLTPDICVIGGGPAGQRLAVTAANSGVPVVLIEKGRLGGADLAHGSGPSKALIAAAGLYDTLRRGPAMGVSGAPLQVNFARLREHVLAAAASVEPAFSAARLAALGIRVIPGEAKFVDRRAVVADGIVIRARRFVLATGAVPSLPAIPGLAGVEPMRLDDAFDLTRKPAHLLLLGAGPHALELAQAYNRLGVDTTVIGGEAPLADEDPELAAIVLGRLAAEGVRFRTGKPVSGVARRRGGIRVTLAGEEEAVDGSHLLLAMGRAPNIAGLRLEAAGIAFDPDGVVVDRLCRTTNRRVYAIGDVVAGPASVARAEHQIDRILLAILYRLPFREYAGRVPQAMFTDPGLARIGLSEAEANRIDRSVRVFRYPVLAGEASAGERLSE